MSLSKSELLQKVQASLATLEAREKSKGRSERTCDDYVRLTASLLKRAQARPEDLADEMRDTGKSCTYYKRLSAVRYDSIVRLKACIASLVDSSTDAELRNASEQLTQAQFQMKALSLAEEQGMSRPREARKSKRPALRGLPADWRLSLCRRGMRGKYARALVVAALTGLRPCELVKGVEIAHLTDETTGTPIVRLRVCGGKVTDHQGQPWRNISFRADETIPLVAELLEHFQPSPDDKPMVYIEKAENFSKEVSRLARSLWPGRKESITAYCLRHQFSADLKAAGDVGAVSQGLGHRSGKTRRTYGTAGQSHGTDRVVPFRIEADRPVSEPKLRRPNVALNGPSP